MTTRNTFRLTAFAALAAASLVALTAQTASAQQVVAATCPDGYTLSNNSCIRTGPTPSCPSGYAFSDGKCSAVKSGKTTTAGQWAFITREAFGVRSAKDATARTTVP